MKNISASIWFLARQGISYPAKFATKTTEICKESIKSTLNFQKKNLCVLPLSCKAVKHLERHNILNDCQHGLRAKRSCETQILTLYHELAASLDKKIQIDMIILDFSKAFDRVPHQCLLKKVHHCGIRGTTYHWISSFLNSRTQQVLVEGQSSEKVPVVSGVPQGSVLGPVLFLIFINDLPDNINSRTRLFADDCILYRQITSETDQRLLQEDLDRLATWEKTWGMEFHPQKCSVMRISRARVARNFQYHLKGVSLAEEQSSKYLGVDLQSNLSWKNHISRITKKSNNMLGFLRRNLRQANEETKAQANFAMVRSNLDYCSTIWSPYQRDQKHQIEMVQRRSARFVTNRYRNTSSVTNMLDYLDWESHEMRRSKLQLIVLYKIVHGLIDIPPTDYLTQTSSRTRAAHKYKYQQYSTSTDCFKYSFFLRTIPLWNRLPAAAAEAPSLVSFKRELSNLTF